MIGALQGKTDRERVLYALSSGWCMTVNDFVFTFCCDMKTTPDLLAEMVAAGEIKMHDDGRYYMDVAPTKSDIDAETRPNGRNETYGT